MEHSQETVISERGWSPQTLFFLLLWRGGRATKVKKKRGPDPFFFYFCGGLNALARMVFLWSFVVSLWFSYGFPIVFLWFWFSYGFLDCKNQYKNHFKTISKLSFHIKAIEQPYQNHSKTIPESKQQHTKSIAKPYQTHSKTIATTYHNHSTTIPKA